MTPLSKILIVCFAVFAAQAYAKSPAEEGLTEFYNGFYNRVFLPDPTTVMDCYNETTANLTLNFLGKFINEMARNQIHLVPVTVTAYLMKLPPAVSKCLAADEELQHVYKLYGIQDKSLEDIAVTVAKFAILHYFKYRSVLILLDTHWNNKFYYEAGRLLGELIQDCYHTEPSKYRFIHHDELKKIFTNYQNEYRRL